MNPKTHKSLHAFVGSEGSVLDANFTGSFPYVWDKQSGDRAAHRQMARLKVV